MLVSVTKRSKHGLIRIIQRGKYVHFAHDIDYPDSLSPVETEGYLAGKMREYSWRPVKSLSQVRRKRYLPGIHVGKRRKRTISARHYDPLDWQTPERAEYLAELSDLLQIVGLDRKDIKADYTVKYKRGCKRSLRENIDDTLDFDVMTFDFDSL